MIPLLGAVPIVRQRFAAPLIVGGRPVRPDPVEAVIEAAVQDFPESRREWLPSGYQLNHVKLIISYSDLREGQEGGYYADRVIFEGFVYEIITVKAQPAFLIQPPHWEAAAIRLQSIEPKQGQP